MKLETANSDPKLFRTGLATIAYQEAKIGSDWSKTASEMSASARVLAGMGLAEPFKQAVLAQLDCVNAEREYCCFTETGKVKFFENRLTVREGVNCISAQRLGNAAAALQLALCQSQPAGPGGTPVIRVFPACPAGWNVRFSLWCHGGFRITSEICDGEIGYIRIESTLGGICRIRNPWSEEELTLIPETGTVSIHSGSLVEFATAEGDEFTIRRGKRPIQ
ncbi:hypothetical protein O9H85_33490 [Paenibacillus filicis]|uniref:Uncharacterized protein n=1 Tax=Paenibacillus gyeongsangnamensis TaxID=3388067 RepID=A0ABT4QJX7_9BACL|nr:hypothetical protein [Paenibacillus filicis]MCZ8517178.1 hypothetical protein [Paenibacillus filicis]